MRGMPQDFQRADLALGMLVMVVPTDLGETPKD